MTEYADENKMVYFFKRKSNNLKERSEKAENR